MSIAEFSKLYEELRSLSLEFDSYKNTLKKDVTEKLIYALKTLKSANDVILKQADSLALASDELVKQCELSRGISKSSSTSTASVTSEGGRPKKFSDVIKSPPVIVVKPKDDAVNMNGVEMKKKAEVALNAVNVRTARVTGQGSLIVQVASTSDHKTATDKLVSEFSTDFTVEAPKKIMPKLTIKNVPITYNEERFLQALCQKDEKLMHLVSNEGGLEVVKIFENKNGVGEVVSKNVIVKCTPEVRKHIMEYNSGYVYLNLSRCRVYDRFFVTRCYHCLAFNHLARNCPDASKPPSCGKCSEAHKTTDCQSTTVKCANCVRYRSGQPNDHSIFSNDCPALIREKSFLKERTNYSTNDPKNQ